MQAKYDRMKLFLYPVILAASVVHISAVHAQDCGSPPVVYDETIKGQIQGDARAIIFGRASISGDIQRSRSDIFQNYPEAEKSRLDAYFLYQLCRSLQDDKELTPGQKRDEWMRIWELFQRPPPVMADGSTAERSTPSPDPRISKLSSEMVIDSDMVLKFYVPPKRVEINYQIIQGDFRLRRGQVTFGLDGSKKTLRLKCGVDSPDRKRGYGYQLVVYGDGKEIFLQEYRAGEDAISSSIGVQGVEALTLVLWSTRGTPPFYCSNELSS